MIFIIIIFFFFFFLILFIFIFFFRPAGHFQPSQKVSRARSARTSFMTSSSSSSAARGGAPSDVRESQLLPFDQLFQLKYFVTRSIFVRFGHVIHQNGLEFNADFKSDIVFKIRQHFYYTFFQTVLPHLLHLRATIVSLSF